MSVSASAWPHPPVSDIQSVPPSAVQPSLQPPPGPGDAGVDNEKQANERDVILSSAVHDSVAQLSGGSSAQVACTITAGVRKVSAR